MPDLLFFIFLGQIKFWRAAKKLRGVEHRYVSPLRLYRTKIQRMCYKNDIKSIFY